MADKTLNIGNSTNTVELNLTGDLKTNQIKAPTTAGGSTYGVGANGQVLTSNGTNTYWGNSKNEISIGTTQPTDGSDLWVDTSSDPAATILIDSAPTQGSQNLITSGGVYNSINTLQTLIGSSSGGGTTTINQTLEFPVGTIVMFSGATIPSKWYLCDGTNGTPNLVDKFIMGSTLANKGQTGGSNEQTLTDVNMPPHNHTISVATAWGSNISSTRYVDAPQQNATKTTTVNTGSFGGSSNNAVPFDNRPAYYTLAYIMYKGV